MVFHHINRIDINMIDFNAFHFHAINNDLVDVSFFLFKRKQITESI